MHVQVTASPVDRALPSETESDIVLVEGIGDDLPMGCVTDSHRNLPKSGLETDGLCAPADLDVETTVRESNLSDFQREGSTLMATRRYGATFPQDPEAVKFEPRVESPAHMVGAHSRDEQVVHDVVSTTTAELPLCVKYGSIHCQS